MAEFFKTLLKGVIYVVLLPFIALFLVLCFIYCLFVFIYMTFRTIIVYFSGGNPNGDLPEDVEAKRRINERFAAPANDQRETAPIDRPTLVTPNQIDEDGEVAPLNEQPSEPVEAIDEENIEEGGNDDGNSIKTY